MTGKSPFITISFCIYTYVGHTPSFGTEFNVYHGGTQIYRHKKGVTIVNSALNIFKISLQN